MNDGVEVSYSELLKNVLLFFLTLIHSILLTVLLKYELRTVKELESSFIPSVVGNTSSPSLLVSASFPVLSKTSAKLSAGTC